MRKIVARPLTADAFLPFGSVADFPVKPGAVTIEGAFDAGSDAEIPVVQLAQVNEAPVRFLVRQLERHPYSAQTFLPLTGADALIVVCEKDESGQPDMASLCAFVASGIQAVTYRRSVWHHSLTPLSAPATFAMTMLQTGRGDDTIVQALTEQYEISFG